MCAELLDLLCCILEDSPQAIHLISEEHITLLVDLLAVKGRDKKVCLGWVVCRGMACPSVPLLLLGSGPDLPVLAVCAAWGGHQGQAEAHCKAPSSQEGPLPAHLLSAGSSQVGRIPMGEQNAILVSIFFPLPPLPLPSLSLPSSLPSLCLPFPLPSSPPSSLPSLSLPFPLPSSLPSPQPIQLLCKAHIPLQSREQCTE